jgi:hypothetical protein
LGFPDPDPLLFFTDPDPYLFLLSASLEIVACIALPVGSISVTEGTQVIRRSDATHLQHFHNVSTECVLIGVPIKSDTFYLLLRRKKRFQLIEMSVLSKSKQ